MYNEKRMKPEKELEKLLQHIQKGLKKYSIKDLNEGLREFLANKNNGENGVEVVLREVAKEFLISEQTLLHGKGRGNITDARHICFCLLHFNYGFSIRYISTNIFSCWHSTIYEGIKRYKLVDEELQSDKMFMEKYRKVQKKIEEELKNN